MLNSSIPMMDFLKSCQSELLSPSQCADHRPDPGKVLLEITNGLFPVLALAALRVKNKVVSKIKLITEYGLLDGGFRFEESIQTVSIVMATVVFSEIRT